MLRTGGIGNSTWPHMVAAHKHTQTHTPATVRSATAVITPHQMCGLISLSHTQVRAPFRPQGMVYLQP